MRFTRICKLRSPLPVRRERVRLRALPWNCGRPSPPTLSRITAEGARKPATCVLCLAAICLLASVSSEAELPATQPIASPPATATRPSVSSIRGRISAGVGWDLQKPDLTRAVLYLSADPLLEAALAGPLPKAVMGQKDKMFIPGFIVVPIGTQVEFPNWDHISHNVFSRSKAGGVHPESIRLAIRNRGFSTRLALCRSFATFISKCER